MEKKLSIGVAILYSSSLNSHREVFDRVSPKIQQVAILYSSSLNSHRESGIRGGLVSSWSQSFIHQVLIPIMQKESGIVADGSMSQSFIHQVLIPMRRCD